MAADWNICATWLQNWLEDRLPGCRKLNFAFVEDYMFVGFGGRQKQHHFRLRDLPEEDLPQPPEDSFDQTLVAWFVPTDFELPDWAENGFSVRYHGTNLYSASAALASGKLVASEPDRPGFEAVCGRGIYTTTSWKAAAAYAVPHIPIPPDEPGHKTCAAIRAVLLVAVPGQHAELTGLWKAPEKKGAGFKLVPTDPSKKELADMALKRGGFKEADSRAPIPSWTFFNDEDYAQETSGQSHILGIIFVIVNNYDCVKAKRARNQKGLLGWRKELEPPFARPRTDVPKNEPNMPRPGRQADKHGQVFSAGAKFKERRREAKLNISQEASGSQASGSRPSQPIRSQEPWQSSAREQSEQPGRTGQAQQPEEPWQGFDWSSSSRAWSDDGSWTGGDWGGDWGGYWTGHTSSTMDREFSEWAAGRHASG